ncbi:hypothetical protein [Enterococcus sp. AZ007]|uniref:hypothetical protein n=1 Tax=Enterococcus sp. AZ007 TaxID=2774839 RepID=UPI003F2970C7
MKVKIFEGSLHLHDMAKLRGMKTIDEKVDDFLTDHPGIEIKHIKQTSASSGSSDSFSTVTTISIWYEED